QRIELRRLHHHIDFDLFVSCADAPAARADLDGWYPQLVVDVGVGPDAGAVRRFRSQPSCANSLRSISVKTFFAASLSSAIRFSWNSSLYRTQIEEWQIHHESSQERAGQLRIAMATIVT